jgi:hypothetical protein
VGEVAFDDVAFVPPVGRIFAALVRGKISKRRLGFVPPPKKVDLIQVLQITI